MKPEEVDRMLEDRLARLGRIRPSRWNREAWRAADDQLVHRLLRLNLPREQVASLVRRYSAEVAVRTASWNTGDSSARRWDGRAGAGVRLARRLGLDRARTRLGETGWQWLGWLGSFRFREPWPQR